MKDYGKEVDDVKPDVSMKAAPKKMPMEKTATSSGSKSGGTMWHGFGAPKK